MGARSVLSRCMIGALMLAGLIGSDATWAQSRATFRRVQSAAQKSRPRAKRPNPNRQGGLNDMVQRLMQMGPSQRRQALANNRRFQQLPDRQKRNIEARLREFDKLPIDRREMVVQRYQLFSRLQPGQQSQARSLYRQWSARPRDSRSRVTQAVRRLRGLGPAQRREALGSDGFANRFDADERKLIEQLVGLAPQAGPPAGRDRQR